MTTYHRFYRSLLVCLVGCAAVCAQTGTGTIQGTVRDATGAVIPGAKVTITHTQTAQAQTTTTNETGFYLLPPVQIGDYEISISATGLETWKGAITLQVRQTAVVDTTLKVGGLVTEVTVAGDVTPIVTSTEPTLGTTVERARIEQLPLNTRMIWNVIGSTIPGVALTMGTGGMSFRTYGLRFASEYLQDGTPVLNRDWGTVAGRPPGLDTIQEMRFETSNSSAKMNRPATIVTTTRSGTNQVHGALFETARNNGIGVARSRTDFYTKPPQLIRNEFGASLGGPVYLPRIYKGRDRTFFFASYEGLRLASKSTGETTMPTAEMRQGDFSGLVNNQGRLYTLYDPGSTGAAPTWTRLPFVNNRIPLTRQSPLSKYLYSVSPLPNQPNVNPLAGPNYFGEIFTATRDNTITTRVDHRLSDRDQVFFRYTHSTSARTGTNWTENFGPVTTDGKANGYFVEYRNDGGVASWTHTFSPTLFSETVVNVSQDKFGQSPIGGLEDYASALGLPNPFKRGGFPTVANTGFNMRWSAGASAWLNYTKVLNFDQNLTKISGRHQFEFGGRYRHEMLNNMPDQFRVMGESNYDSLATGLYDPSSGSAYSAVPFSGHTAANFFLGVARNYGAYFRRTFLHMRAKEFAGYFQDNFRVNSRLTLNFGVRYEYNNPIKERDNLLVGFDLADRAVIVPGSMDYLVQSGVALPSIAAAYANLGVKYKTQREAGIPERFVRANWLDFGPRLGFAYRLGGQSRPAVVRGGYALFAYPAPLRTWDTNLMGTIPTAAYFAQDWNVAQQSPDGRPNYLLRASPPVIAGVNSANVLDINNPSGVGRGTGNANGGGVFFFDPDQPTTRAHQWNLTLEKAIFSDTSVKGSYIGTHATRIEQYVNHNDPVNPYIWHVTTGQLLPTGEYAGVAMRPYDQNVYSAVNQYQKSGWSNNQAFQIEVQHRYARGYAFQVFYVLQNSLAAFGNRAVLSTNPIHPTANFLPGAVPQDERERNRFLNYFRDRDTPQHRFVYNWLVDLPFGRGKLLGSRANGFLDRVIGGWQIAGSGSIESRWWNLPTSNYSLGKVEIYGKKYQVEDCRSGVCYPGYLYWNGYIPANRINSYDANGKPNGVMGVPGNYVPAHAPLIATPANGGSPSDPMYAFYETNNVWVPLKNGTLQRVAYNDNLHPWRNQFVAGTPAYALNASLFKSIRIRESMFLRFNADFFNVLNMAGMPLPGADGIVQMRNSAYEPRQLQLTVRLSW
ncbi:MAG: carboxypeptidase regulatory-like domain-containing protein [Bryobacteraceae bacterium]|nr:carboxypeptidase regulatory-like domain-containing protein [Bryobacteraceae bacterium]